MEKYILGFLMSYQTWISKDILVLYITILIVDNVISPFHLSEDCIFQRKGYVIIAFIYFFVI